MISGFKFLLSCGIMCCLTLTSVNAEKLIVAFSDMGKPPLTFTKASNRKGVYKKLLQAVGKITGDTFIFKYYPPKRIMKRFEQGYIDIEMGINPGWRRSSKVPGHYTIPFSKAENVLVFGQGKKVPVQSAKDLKGKTLGTIRGYYYFGYMDAFSSGEIKRDESNDEETILKRIFKGRFDQAIMTKEIAQYWIKVKPKFRTMEIGDTTSSVDIMIRVHPKKKRIIKRFNAAIRQLQKSGKIDKVYSEYR